MLLHRIIGLCDATADAPEKFDEHEMVFQISKLLYFGFLFSFFLLVNLLLNPFTMGKTVDCDRISAAYVCQPLEI